MKARQVKSFRLLKIKVTPDASLEKVWKLLERRDITLVPVVTEKNILVGVIGEDDLLYRLVPDYREYFSEFFPEAPDIDDIGEKLRRAIKLTARDVMNEKVVDINGNQPISKALSKMMANRFRVLPVVDEEKHYLGMIMEDDIMQYLFERYQRVVARKK